MSYKIEVKVKPNSKKEGVELQPDGLIIVKVNTPPIEGKANKRVIELLAEYLDIPKSKIVLKIGLKSKIKKFEVTE